MKKGLKKCPFCANEIEENSFKCPYCDEILDGGEKTNETISYNTENGKKNNKTGLIILGTVGCLIILGILAYTFSPKSEKESWQGIYYPEGLTHIDGEESFGPIFDDYKSCEKWGLEQLSEESRDSMCVSECNGEEEGTPICDNIVRSWKPFPSSKIYEGAEEIRNNILDKEENDSGEELINEEELENQEIINEGTEETEETEGIEELNVEENEEADKGIIIEEENQENTVAEKKEVKVEKQTKKENKNNETEKNNDCVNIKSEINRQISEIERKKSNVLCNNLNNKYESIRQLENKKNNVKYEAASMYNEGDSAAALESTMAQLRENYQSQIDALYWEISNQNVNECNQEKENNKKYDEMISQLKQSAKAKGCSY